MLSDAKQLGGRRECGCQRRERGREGGRRERPSRACPQTALKRQVNRADAARCQRGGSERTARGQTSSAGHWESVRTVLGEVPHEAGRTGSLPLGLWGPEGGPATPFLCESHWSIA